MHVRPFVSHEIEYLSADEEDNYVVAQANALLDADGHFLEDRVEVRDAARTSASSRRATSTTWTCRPSRSSRWRRR